MKQNVTANQTRGILMTFYINARQTDSVCKISGSLRQCILHYRNNWSELVFLCIGTDRVTGDCLGPFVGQKLSSYSGTVFSVYGTLFQPVHALNLTDIYQHIQTHHPNALIIAIDASLGEKKHLGYVTIANGALHPGAAIHKQLPSVGHIHITGIVNVSGVLEQLTLQTTRLSTVIFLADKIVQGILESIPLSKTDFKQIL
ncbi:spore protease YyaC [Blautia glucerasea]|jgi:putative sporulation protein YyaC|nr:MULTISPECIES: spore protease YyaC [Blautia]MCB5549603.1 spore protease YyaC [Blautia sp. MSK17_66]MCB6368559.1 spore protease YyaC [Blautia glucerasea]